VHSSSLPDVETLDELEVVVDSICMRRNCLVKPVLEVRPDPERPGCAEVVVTHTVLDRDTGLQVEVSMGVLFYLPERPLTVVARVRDVFVALLAHEVHEGMHYEGTRLFDPHTITVK
jgi:hypothetical protein